MSLRRTRRKRTKDRGTGNSRTLGRDREQETTRTGRRRTGSKEKLRRTERQGTEEQGIEEQGTEGQGTEEQVVERKLNNFLEHCLSCR